MQAHRGLGSVLDEQSDEAVISINDYPALTVLEEVKSERDIGSADASPMHRVLPWSRDNGTRGKVEEWPPGHRRPDGKIQVPPKRGGVHVTDGCRKRPDATIFPAAFEEHAAQR